MKDYTRRIAVLRREIFELSEKIGQYKLTRPAFARRLDMILEKKNSLLESWISKENY